MTCHKKGKVYYASTRRGKRRWSEVGGWVASPPRSFERGSNAGWVFDSPSERERAGWCEAGRGLGGVVG